MSIEIDDKDLEATPQGRFLIAVAEAVDAMNLEGVEAIRVTGDADMPRGTGSEILIAPLSELPPEERRLGQFGLRPRARVNEVQKNDAEKVRSVGWRLKVRNQLIRRFGGMTEDGSQLQSGDYCFGVLGVTFGPLYDEQSRLRGVARSEIMVTGEYHGA